MSSYLEHAPGFKIRVGNNNPEHPDRVQISFGVHLNAILLLPEEAIEIAKSIIASAEKIIEARENHKKVITGLR